MKEETNVKRPQVKKKSLVTFAVYVSDRLSLGICWFVQPILKFTFVAVMASVSIYWMSIGVLSLKETAFAKSAAFYAKQFESVATAQGFERTSKALSRDELETLAYKVARDSGDPDPKFFVSMVTVESAFDPNAFSEKGAMGIAQVMPKNLQKYGIKSLKDAANPEKNLKIAWDIDNKNKKSVSGDKTKRLCLYNWGSLPGKNGWMPEETRDYIVKVNKKYAS